VKRNIALLLAAVLALPLIAFSQGPAASPRPLTVKVERALVALIYDNKVPATEVGMLTAVSVKEGDLVEKDAFLARIDDRETLAKQRIAESERNAALATAANEAELEVAQKAKDVSWAELESQREIMKDNPKAISKTELRKYEFQYDKSIAQEKQAINEMEIARLTAGAKQAQLDATEVELDLRQVKSPFKGVVVEIFKHPGDWVQAGEEIMHVVGLDKVRVKGMVRIRDAAAAEVLGKPVTITVNGSGDKQHTVKGIIGFASPLIVGVGEARHFHVWSEVDNKVLVDPVTKQATWEIQPGSFAAMEIDLSPPKPAPAAKGDAKGTAKGAGDAKSGDPKGTKVESYKPVVGGDKADTKTTSPASRER
jgi:multidrug efflux pump subunit AcrA (membrane-fusion protein)